MQILESITVKHKWWQLHSIFGILLCSDSYSFLSFKILAPGKKDDADLSFHVAWGDLWLFWFGFFFWLCIHVVTRKKQERPRFLFLVTCVEKFFAATAFHCLGMSLCNICFHKPCGNEWDMAHPVFPSRLQSKGARALDVLCCIIF